MGFHASTRERLPIIDQFYATTLGDIAPVHSVLDLACGLNPLAIPWMPLAPNAAYHAYDMYLDLTSFLQSAMNLLGIHGVAYAEDVTYWPSFPHVEVAFLLKAIPCLEQLDKSAGAQLLDAIPARYILVSFPKQSLGGQAKGMSVHYEAHFRELADGKGWNVRRFVFDTELAFLVGK